MTPDPVSLKDFIEFRFARLEQQVTSMDERLKALEDCISNDVKHAIRMWRYIGGIVVAVAVALIIAWMLQKLGL